MFAALHLFPTIGIAAQLLDRHAWHVAFEFSRVILLDASRAKERGPAHGPRTNVFMPSIT
jgi:hypothetical protein